MNTDQIKEFIQNGEWVSIAPELRPSTIKNPDGSIKPFYLTRAFQYAADDAFELKIINSADPYGKIPLVKILIKGHIVWQGDHPIAARAQKIVTDKQTSEQLAAYVYNTIQGMRVLIKAGAKREQMKAISDITLKSLQQ